MNRFAGIATGRGGDEPGDPGSRSILTKREQVRDTSSGKQHQDRQQRIPVAGHHVEGRDGERQGAERRIEDAEAPPVAPGLPRAKHRERQHDAKVHPQQQSQDQRVVRIGLHRLGVSDFGRAERHQEFTAHQQQPLPGLMARELQSPLHPVVGNLRGGQPAARRGLGQAHRVGPLERDVAAVDHERLMHARVRRRDSQCRNSAPAATSRSETDHRPGSS